MINDATILPCYDKNFSHPNRNINHVRRFLKPLLIHTNALVLLYCLKNCVHTHLAAKSKSALFDLPVTGHF